MKVRIIKIIFSDAQILPTDIPKIRGYFSKAFPDNVELHNHLPGGKFSYKFPQIQYRIINQHPALIAINNGCDIIKKIFLQTDEIIIKNNLYKINEKEVSVTEESFGENNSQINYKFISPWMALNQENYKKYKIINPANQQTFLKHILRENLKTLSKGFNYTIPDIEKIKVFGKFNSQIINFKNRKVLGFRGNFSVNFHIPEFLGLGKQSARGFGIVTQSSCLQKKCNQNL